MQTFIIEWARIFYFHIQTHKMEIIAFRIIRPFLSLFLSLSLPISLRFIPVLVLLIKLYLLDSSMKSAFEFY